MDLSTTRPDEHVPVHVILPAIPPCSCPSTYVSITPRESLIDKAGDGLSN